MNRFARTPSVLHQALVFIALVSVAVVGRWLVYSPEDFGAFGLWLDLPPNFTPTAAAAIFAGFFFPSLWVALAVPVATLMISNKFLPEYQHVGVMASVYITMLLPVLSRLISRTYSGWQIGGSALVSATAFFLVTNLAVWHFERWYTHDFAGLVSCFIYAAPFYKWTLGGDLLFTGLFFTIYYAVVALTSREAALNAEPTLAAE